VTTCAVLAGGVQKTRTPAERGLQLDPPGRLYVQHDGGSIGELFAGRDLRGFHVNPGFGRAGKLAVTTSTLSSGIASSACRRRCSLGQLVGDRIGQLGPRRLEFLRALALEYGKRVVEINRDGDQVIEDALRLFGSA
jgi:hypothetical protein